jgi:hypothetical protein
MAWCGNHSSSIGTFVNDESGGLPFQGAAFRLNLRNPKVARID